MLEEYIYKDNKKMRLGYTTGSCATAAAKAATLMLLSEKEVKKVELLTPKGILLNLEVLEISQKEKEVSCAIQKDAGDDPDATHGILVYAKAVFSENEGVTLRGGIGVGTVTKRGLEQEVGDPAINRVPRQMIKEAVKEACEFYDYAGGIEIEISIPEGVEIGKKTFNPRLGIVGGISILGTSGIVEPMSEAALIETIRVEIRMQIENGKKYLLLVPGNYGIDFLSENHSEILERSIKCSNFVGEAIDAAVEYGAKGILLIGHIGKFVKLSGGIMNTHSRHADARMELFTAHTALCGGEVELLKEIMSCVTTDEALTLLEAKGLKEAVMKSLMEKMEFFVNHRAYDKLESAVITFSNQHGFLGETTDAQKLLKKLEEES